MREKINNTNTKIMKNIYQLVIAAAALTLFASAGNTSAQSQLSGPDGIAASPKVRAVLNERVRSQFVVPAQVTAAAFTRQTAIAASPKMQQMLNDRARVAASANPETAGPRVAVSDGIAASPKVRAMLDERRQTVEIAPLK
jgi:hypothetical protein